MIIGLSVGSRGVPCVLKYMKRNGRAGPASYIASKPSFVQSWHTRCTSAKSKLAMRKGDMATFLWVPGSVNSQSCKKMRVLLVTY
jgi:hypothetical protein